jgi:hypothetical protein
MSVVQERPGSDTTEDLITDPSRVIELSVKITYWQLLFKARYFTASWPSIMYCFYG